MLTFVAALALALQALPSPSPGAPPTAAAVSDYHVVFLELGPKWVRDLPAAKQSGIREHGQNMSALSAKGTLVLGGPFLADPAAGTVSGAMVIVATADAAEARRIMEADPGVVSGLLRITEVKRLVVATGAWRPWAKEAAAPPAR